MRNALLSLCLLPLFAAPDLGGVTAEEGLKVTKTYVNTLSIELVEFEVTVDGEPQELPADQLPSVTITDEEEVVFIDEYVAVSGGRATEILRTFQTLNDSSSQVTEGPDGETREESEVGESKLLDQTVRFVWDEEDESYAASFAEDSDADESLLERLEGDADFLFLLNSEDMEVGDTWEVDVLALDLVSSPSGDLRIVAPDSNEDMDDAFAAGFRDGLDGRIDATLEAIEDRVAQIAFSGEVTTEFELEDPSGASEAQQFSFVFEVGGTLLWDLKRGTAAEFQFGGDVSMEVMSPRTNDGSELVLTQSFEGEFESAAVFQ